MRKKTVHIPLMMAVLLGLSACGVSNVANVTEGTNVTETTGTPSQGAKTQNSATIQLLGESASSTSDAVAIDGQTVTITDEGTYWISGTLDDGMIVVNAEETDVVELVLDGVEIANTTSAAIYVPKAGSVQITTASGSENALENGGEYVAIDDNNIDAVIFSKADLTLSGEGTLAITATAGHGIVSKDNLVLNGGTYEITAASHGVSGKDSVQITDGTYTITSEKDAIHSKGTLSIEDGMFTLNSGDDAIHADGALHIQDGTFAIPKCYEGIEGLSVTIEDGTFDITSEDDGINAADGTDDEETGDKHSMQKQESSSSDVFITINGGTFAISSGGDSLDSNGDLTINGGTLNLTCNGNGDSAIDCDGTYTNNGGDVTTNDGSEDHPNQIGGGMRGQRDMEAPEGENAPYGSDAPEVPGGFGDPGSMRPERGRH